MKKFILLLAIVALFCQSLFAQTGGINFQGVARNASGAILANQKINLKFSILKTTETGTVEYTETKEATTNAQGVFAVVVGEVNATSFAAVDWKVTPKFLKVEMDATGGTSFITMGTTRLQNVPYAYYANGVNANNIDGAVPLSKGGTGATDAVSARTNLGLVIGTNVQAPLTAGTDYLTPTGNAATATKLVAPKKINGIDFDGSANITISADANTLSGTVTVVKGGTGATTAADARANLGLVIGTNVQAPLVPGTDYLTPTGSAAGLTSFPILNQNTTGNAATATFAGNISASSNSSLTTLSNLTSVGTLTSGTISLTTDIKTSGKLYAGDVSYPQTHGTSGQILSTTGSGTLTWTTPYRLTGGTNGQLLVSGVNGITTWQGDIQGISKITNKSITTNSFVDPFGFGWNSFSPIYGGPLDVRTGENIGNGINILSNNNSGIANVGLGINNLSNNESGSANTTVGFNSLKGNTSGQNNSAVGTYTLYSNTTGSSNSSFGNTSMISNTMGDNNSAFGESTLFANTTGYNNSAFGGYALNRNLTGDSNSAFGANSLLQNTGGMQNTAIGYGALYNNASGNFNTALGAQADVASNNLTNATAIGFQAQVASSNSIQLGNSNITKVNTSGALTTGSVTYPTTHGNNGQVLSTTGSGTLTWTSISASNIADASTLSGTVSISKGGTGAITAAAALTNLGAESILNKSTDINQDASSTSKYPSVKLIKDYVDTRVVSGVSSSTDLIVSSINGLKLGKGAGNGYSNIALGIESLFKNTSGGTNFAASYQSLYNNTIGNFNTSIGTQALFSNVDGNDNLALGYQALYRNTSGNSNIAIGGSALENNTTGENNIANGLLSLNSNTVGRDNIALGYKSLFSNTMGYSNISNGYRALYSNDIGHSNIALGYESLFSNITGAFNFAASYQSMYYNTMGINNISIGYQSLFNNVDGNDNLALGNQSLYRNLSGLFNVAIGGSALENNTTGGWNTAIGERSLYNNTIGENNVAIGKIAGSSNTTGSNNIFIGYQSSASSPTVSNTINLGNSSITTLRAQVTSITSLSDRRDKTDIKNISEGLDFLKQLRPVSFTWNTRDKAKVGIKSAGFIAQELLSLQKSSAIGDNLDLVSQDNPEKLEARYNNLLPVIVKAIQELNESKDEEFSQLKTEKDKEIAELKARVHSLEELINKVLDAKKP